MPGRAAALAEIGIRTNEHAPALIIDDHLVQIAVTRAAQIVAAYDEAKA